MFAHSYSGLSRTCYGESTPYALQKSSVLRWPQKHDDDDDETYSGHTMETIAIFVNYRNRMRLFFLQLIL